MNRHTQNFLDQDVVDSTPNPALPPCCTRILVVDADADARVMNATILMQAGYNVQTATDGADAWEAINFHNYDLLITENKMTGMTGLQLLKDLRSRGITMPVIMAAGAVPTEELKHHPLLRLDAVLVKPVPMDELLGTVTKVLHSAESIARSSKPVKNHAGKITPVAALTKLAKRILVVDDEPLIRQLYADLLLDPGYEVDTAENGAFAWAALQRNHYDLLITDNDMPQMSGIELLKKIRAFHVAVPVILVSGTMPVAELKQHPELHLDAALLKPFNITEFANLVKKVLHVTDAAAAAGSNLFQSEPGNRQMPAAPAETAKPAPTYPLQRILVVDDDADVRQLNVDVLVRAGYEAEGVWDGAAGWEALQTFDYDLVITDNKMPRMTGLEMIEKLHAARMNLPIIMATGTLPTEEFERRPWLKPALALQRPFSNDDLLGAVKKILGPWNANDRSQKIPLPKQL